MISDDIELGPDKRYAVIQLGDDHVDELKTMLKNRLTEICYGKGCIEMEPDVYTYHKACKNLWTQLSGISSQRQYAIIAEIIMHLISPTMIHFDVEPLSVALSLQDMNIKHGFDINFYEPMHRRIWYGEVKSGNNQKRIDLIKRAHTGLKDYFENIEAKGKKNTSYRWDAAKNEARVIFSTDTNKLKQLVQLLTESKNGILGRQKGKKNALIMAVNFGIAKFPREHRDIKKYIENTDKLQTFDNYIVLSVAKKQADDIISFLKQEGERNG